MPEIVDQLPDDFLFGVACADHQCEAYDPAFPPDVWDWWEQRGMVPQPRGQAIDFWNRYPEYIRLARDLGCNAFRFSIAWARVEPRHGTFDPAVLDHYAKVAATVRDHGMEPVVTLCHYVWPMHVQWAGGLAGRDFPARFAEYTGQVSDALAPHVRYWLTFNEPNDLAVSHSQLNRRFPPSAPDWVSFRDQVSEMEALIRNIFLAHREARAVLRSASSGSSALVSMNSDVRGFPLVVRRLLNWWITHFFGSARAVRNYVGRLLSAQPAESVSSGLGQLARTLAILVDGDWCEMGALGRLPSYLCPAGCENQLDYLAFDFYYAVRWPWQIRRLSASIDGHFERAPVYAPALFDTIMYYDRLFKKAFPPHGKPILIAENGLVDQPSAYKARGQNPPASAVDRATYIRDHVHQVQRARAAGADVVGYLVWSLTSNREWGLRFGPASDFGLFGINLDNDSGLDHPALPLTLHPSAAAELYREIIRRRGVTGIDT